MRSVSVSPEVRRLSREPVAHVRRQAECHDRATSTPLGVVVFGLAITASRGLGSGLRMRVPTGMGSRGKRSAFSLASGFCITKTHLATPLLHGMCFVQTVVIRFFSYSQLHVVQRSNNQYFRTFQNIASSEPI